jgi:hypothetical protein
MLTSPYTHRLGLSAYGPQPNRERPLVHVGTSLTSFLSGPLHRNVFAVASLFHQALRKLIEGQVWLYWSDPVLGLDHRYAFTDTSPDFNDLELLIKDTFDTENSTMFEHDEIYGLGGWGDPNDDIQITTGGFKDIVRVYPSPHRIRREYTLQPLANIPNPFPNDPLAPPINPAILINGTFTQANYDSLLNGFLGDFRGFQAYLEGPRVRDYFLATTRCSRSPD